MQNEQETPAEMTPRLYCHRCCRPTKSLVLGVCDACSQMPPWVSPMWGAIESDGCRIAALRDPGVDVTVSHIRGDLPSPGSDIRIITAAHTGGHVEWPRIQTVDVSAATSAVQEVEWAKERLQSYIRPSRIKGPDGIYRCPECGCHEGEIHTGPCLGRSLKAREIRGTAQEEARKAFLRDTCPECGGPQESHTSGACLERRLEEKAKQGIYAALADLRSHGADMRVRISRLRWIPKYTPKAEPVVAPARRRMTFRDFMHKMVNAIGDFFWMAV